MRERAAQELSPEMGRVRRRRSGEGFSAGPPVVDVDLHNRLFVALKPPKITGVNSALNKAPVMA